MRTRSFFVWLVLVGTACGARTPVDMLELGSHPAVAGASGSAGSGGTVAGVAGGGFAGVAAASGSAGAGVAGTGPAGGSGGGLSGGTGGVTMGGAGGIVAGGSGGVVAGGSGGTSGAGMGGGGTSGSAGSAGQPPRATSVAAGAFHTCARYEDGSVRCWGTGAHGMIGSGNVLTIGDDETPNALPPVAIGGSVSAISANWYASCALLDSNRLRCFGAGISGLLGYGNPNDVGDDEAPASAGDVQLGGGVKQVSVGPYHACAVLDSGKLRCWGQNSFFQCGRASTATIGDDESVTSAGFVDVGGSVLQVAAGTFHTCALLTNGHVRCWGSSGSRLGYGNGNLTVIGDDETPASAGDVPLGGLAMQIAVGTQQSCALLDNGHVRCWGSGAQVGYPGNDTVGDDETPASVGDVDVGGTVVQLAAGSYGTCALLDNGHVRCWGVASQGELGYGNLNDIGDDETPASAGDVDVGGKVTRISAGFLHVCAVLDTGRVRCWGRASTGALGYGNTRDVGDDETPASAGDIETF